MLKYKDKIVDYEFVSLALMSDEQTRKDIFVFLKQNRHQIDDESVLGVLHYLEVHNDDFSKIQMKIKKLSNQKFSKAKVKLITPLSTAAILLLFISLGIFYNSYRKSFQEVVFEPQDMGLQNMLNKDVIPEHWFEFMNAYHLGDFKNAWIIIEEMPSTINADSLNYFKGITAYKLEEFERSAIAFNQLSTNSSSVFFQDSQYFLALSYFKAGNFKKSKIILEDIIKEGYHPFEAEAKALLSQF